MLRRLVQLVALVVAAAVVYVGVTFVQVWRDSRRDEARQAQAIVVFGAAQYDGRPSPVLRARLDHAIDLYERGLADVVVVTGGSRPGDRFTEATASATYLRRHGVPESSILREVSGHDSWQSLASAANFLKRRGRSRMVLVSDGFHSARIAAMAHELGLEAYTSPAPSSPIRGPRKLAYVGRETLIVAAGRVLGFRRIAGIDATVRPGA